MNRIVIDLVQKQEQKIVLNREQEHYLKRVLRLKIGDRFIALDGKGLAWLVELQENTGEIISPWLQSTELPVNVTLAVALPKGNGFEEILRHCTEIGAKTLIPVISDRTLNQPSPQKLERWRKIVLEAVEQSERQIVPQVREPQPLNQVFQEFSQDDLDGYICVTRNQSKHLLNCLKEKKPRKIMILTGPEGGWNTREIEKAIATGITPVSLGNRILRAVTAPMVALSLVAAIVES